MTQDNKINGFYRGQVLEHLTHGYCRIYIPGIYPEIFKEHIEMIPPAELAASLFGGVNGGSGEFTYPNIDSIVWCFFANGDLNMPVYFASSLGGENAFGQYEIIKKPSELCSTRHLITSGKTQIELFENGKMQCLVSNPDRRPAAVNYVNNGDITEITGDSVSSYVTAEKVQNKEISNINCLFILDNDYYSNGMALMKTYFYDLSTSPKFDYKLSSINNFTMTNDGEIILDSLSSYKNLIIKENNTSVICSDTLNDFDMQISNGVCLKNSDVYTKEIDNSYGTINQHYEDFNTFSMNNSLLCQEAVHMSVYYEYGGGKDINSTLQIVSKFSQGYLGAIAIDTTYDLVEKTPDCSTKLNTAKSINMQTDREINSFSNQLTFNKGCEGCSNNAFKATLAETKMIVDKAKFASDEKLFAYSLTDKDSGIELKTNIAENIDSGGNILKTMSYSSSSASDTLLSEAELSITKDRGFSLKINITASGSGATIDTTAYRGMGPSITGASDSRDNSINVDGLAFDKLELNAKVSGGATGDEVDCVVESIHDTETASYCEKITNNVAGEACEANIIIDAKSGTIKLNIATSEGRDNSHIILNKNGVIRLNSSKAILLESNLIRIDGKIQTDVNSHYVNLSGDTITERAASKIWLEVPKGAVKIHTMNGSNKIF